MRWCVVVKVNSTSATSTSANFDFGQFRLRLVRVRIGRTHVGQNRVSSQMPVQNWRLKPNRELMSVGPDKHLTMVAATSLVTSVDHPETVRQTGPMCRIRVLVALRNPHPPIRNGKLALTCSARREMPKSRVKHCNVETAICY